MGVAFGFGSMYSVEVKTNLSNLAVTYVDDNRAEFLRGYTCLLDTLCGERELEMTLMRFGRLDFYAAMVRHHTSWTADDESR